MSAVSNTPYNNHLARQELPSNFLCAGTRKVLGLFPTCCGAPYSGSVTVSRMLNAGIPVAKVAKIVGWSPATMVRMAARYGYFSLNELRGVVESISRAEIQAESPVSEFSSAKGRAN